MDSSYTYQHGNQDDLVINVALCEDSLDDVKSFLQFLEESLKTLKVNLKLTVFHSGEALLFHVLDNPSMFDILYLDILLNKKTGMDVAHELRKRGSKTKIIFLTASYEYILDAFDVQPVNYLIKHQFGTEKFIQVLKQALNQIEEDRKKIFYCEYKGNKYMIPLHKIQYFEVWNKMITIYHDDQQTKFYARLSDVIDKLNPEHFIQVHRSYIINLAQVTEIKKNTIILKHNLQIPIGKTYVQQFEKAFEDFMLNSETLKLGDDVS